MNKSGKFRKKKIYFTQVSNVAIKDKNLSLKAKGLYALIQSYLTIQDFTLYKTTLKKDCLEGEKAFESTWKELKDKGYLIQYRLQNDNGQFYYEYELLDAPLENETEKENEQKTTPPKKEGMDNIQRGKETKWRTGVYNNTNLNNTDLNNTNLNNNLSSTGDRSDLTEGNLKEKNKLLMEECIEKVQKNYPGTFKPYELKKMIIASCYDFDLIEYAYDKSIESIEENNNIKNLGAYMLKIIKNEIKE